MDHLTCGQCLREFPLYMITTFIQHKKLDCGDEIVMETTSPELLCGYCPMGFMTAWGLLMHAQITHNLRIFLEKSSASTRASLPQTQPPTQPDHTTADVPSTAESSVMSDTAGGTVMARSMDRSNGETVFDMSGQGKAQSSIVTGKLTVSSGKGRELRFVREDAINQGISNVYVPNADTSVNIVTKGTCNVNTSPTVPRDVLSKDNSSSLGKVSTSATVPSRRYLSVIAPVRESVTMTEDGTIDVSPSSKPSTHLPQTVSPPKATLGDLWHVSSSSSLKTPVMDVEQANKVEPAQQGGATETTTTEYLSMPTLDALVGSATFNSGQDSTMEDGVIEETANEPQSTDAIQPNEITTMGSITSSLVSTEPHQQGDDSSSGTGPASTVMETEEVARQEGCCENQGCGVTVIPGSHQQLQDCCNAVLPKKRKRHMEMKHMPFSFSSSRYGRRKTFSSMKQCSSGACRFNSGSTIYIDVGPDTFVPETSTVEVTTSKPPTANVTVSTSQQPPASAKSAPVKRLLIPPQSRPRSLILKPGAVFAIPFSCTMPTSSNTASAPLIIPTASSQEGAVAQAISGSEQTESLSTLPTDTGNNTTPTHPAMTTSVPSNPDGDRMDHGYSALYSAGRQFQCGDCSLSFNQRIHLKKHTSKHTGIKPYKCGQCDYSTVERSHLKVHIRIHTGEKPFKCTYCEYATAQNSTLKIHLKRHHGGRMFRCGGCEKTFTQERQLNNHEWEHNPGVALVARHETISSENEASTSITTPQPSHHAEATVIPVDNLTPELAGQGTSHGTSNQTTDSGHVTSPPRDGSV